MFASSFLVALALASGASTSPAKSSSVSPLTPGQPKKAVKPSASATLPSIPGAQKRTKLLQPTRDSEGADAMAALMRSAGSGGSKFEKRVAKSLRKHGVSPDAARALLGGKGSAKADRAALVEGIGRAHAAPMVYLRPAISLPPENVPVPKRFALDLSGLVTTQTHDGDGTDELSALAIVASPSGDDFTLTTVDLGSQSSPVGSLSLSKSVFDGAPRDVLFVTALLEGDAASAQAAKTELETLVAIAASVAATMPGEDRLAVLRAMVDLTITLDDNNGSASAPRSVVSTHVAAGEWSNLWAADATETGDLRWKVAIPHAIGSGRYEMLFDVPSNIPTMTTVRLSLSDLHVVGVPSGASLDWVTVTAGIGKATYTQYVQDLDATSLVPLERKVIDGSVSISADGEIRWRERLEPDPEFGAVVDAACKKAAETKNARARRRCKQLRREQLKRRRKAIRKVTKPIDFAPGPATDFTADYSTRQRSFVAAPNPKAKPSAKAAKKTTGRTKTAKGTGSPRGRLRLTANNG